MARDSLGHEPGHADMDAVAERGDGRAAIPRRARYDRRCSVLLSNKKENRRSEKLRFLAAPKPTVFALSLFASSCSPPIVFCSPALAAVRRLTHMAEASALRDRLLLAQRLVLAKYKIQADCMEVVDTMLEGGYSATASAAIYDECSQLWEDFDAISISHCNRESNVVAHELARQAMLEEFLCLD